MFRRKDVKIFNVPDWSDTTTKTYDLSTVAGREQVPINLDEVKGVCFIYVRENNEYYRLISDTTSGTTRTLVFNGSKKIIITINGTVMTVEFSTDADVVPDGSISEVKLTSDLINKIEFTKTIEDVGGFENAVKSTILGTYTGNNCTINSPINLSDVNVANHIKVFTNISFTLNDNMFTWDTGYKLIPSFINCVFYGGNNIVADGKYPIGARFINCIFCQCGFINNCSYVQSIRFIGCRFIGDNDIISGIGCSDIVFDECQCEADFHGSVVNMTAEDNMYSIDKLSIKNSVIEGNTFKEIIKFNRCATIDIDSCYFEGNSLGVIKATEAKITTDFIVLNISNTKMHSCGDPYLYIDASYRANKLKLVINSCTLSTLTTGTARALLNRYEYRFSIIDCKFINVTSDESFSINYRLMEFARSIQNDTESPITATVQLSPYSVYYLMQSRGLYTGIIIYVIATHVNSFVVQKICDDNNRWTITDNGVQENGRISITITSTWFGTGKVIYLGSNES